MWFIKYLFELLVDLLNFEWVMVSLCLTEASNLHNLVRHFY